jgi:peptide deformylase
MIFFIYKLYITLQESRMNQTLLCLFFALFLTQTAQATMNIVTIYDDPTKALSTKASPIELNVQGLSEAKDIARNLRETLLPLMPAAGLAAPQIGIKKRVVIFSWDRSSDNLQAAINPSYEPLRDEAITGWEACFSSAPQTGPCQATHLPRYHEILAKYYDLDGKLVQVILRGFAAKVFQHECDHLEGMVNVRHDKAEVKDFPTYEEFVDFLSAVKAKDSVSYLPPEPYKG